MKRREFIVALGGTALTRPIAALAQPSDPVRRIGVLHTISQTDVDARQRVTTFEQTLQKLGWTVSRNLQIEYRWAGGDPNRVRVFAGELINQGVDLIVAVTTIATIELARQTSTMPIVFIQVPDPVVLGLVNSLSRPGTNVTGFTNFEFAMGGKWLQILKEVAPRLSKVALLHNSQTDPQSKYYMDAIEAAASGLTIIRSAVKNREEIEECLSEVARDPSAGLVVIASTFNTVNRRQIIHLANRLSIPAIYPFRYFATDDGLVSYGVDTIDLYRRAASYVDRILRGTNPADLPVQLPTKFELVINLKTARALGLVFPPTLLALADEVIE